MPVRMIPRNAAIFLGDGPRISEDIARQRMTFFRSQDDTGKEPHYVAA